MPFLLTVLGSLESAGETSTSNEPPEETLWQTFLAQRTELTNSMELATCNGCDQCGTRCIDGFAVVREEFDAIQEYLRSQPVDEVARIAAQRKTLPWPGSQWNEATVTYCRYRDLEKGQCSVYPVRPTICRLFGQTHWLPCPIEAISHYPENAPDVWNAYRCLERHTFEEWDKISVIEKENSEETPKG